jgi:hypothetical protein
MDGLRRWISNDIKGAFVDRKYSRKSSNSTKNRGDVVFETIDSSEPVAMQSWMYAGLLQGNVDYVVENVVPRNRGG